MHIKVNKKISSKSNVKYAAINNALNMATSSGVWHDEDTSAQGASKRKNHIRLTRDMFIENRFDA